MPKKRPNGPKWVWNQTFILSGYLCLRHCADIHGLQPGWVAELEREGQPLRDPKKQHLAAARRNRRPPVHPLMGHCVRGWNRSIINNIGARLPTLSKCHRRNIVLGIVMKCGGGSKEGFFAHLANQSPNHSVKMKYP